MLTMKVLSHILFFYCIVFCTVLVSSYGNNVKLSNTDIKFCFLSNKGTSCCKSVEETDPRENYFLLTEENEVYAATLTCGLPDEVQV